MASPASVNVRPPLPNASKMCLEVAPQRHAHANLVGASCYGVGEHSVQSDRGQQQREQSECAHQRCALRRRRQLAVHDLLKCQNAPDRLVLIDRPDRLAERGNK